MTERRDSLGRIIPTYDRSAQAKKAQANRKKKEGKNVHARIGAIGGSRRTRGYFGTLKDEGKTEELRSLAKAANLKSTEARRRKRDSVHSSENTDTRSEDIKEESQGRS